MIICHGLFGSSRNWRALAKSFARSLERPVYTLDMRNHGVSPRSEAMDYSHMANDILKFCVSQELTGVTLLGHSMGGKAVMALALQTDLPADLLSSLIVVDMSPAKGPISETFVTYLQGMKEVEASNVTERKEADKILQKYEEDFLTRQFLLTNLLPTPANDPAYKFQIPLDILASALPSLGDFPHCAGERKWLGPTLFIKGEKSKYINRHNIPLARKYFPNMKLETINGAGHWVHSERPIEFTKVVNDFVSSVH